MAAVVQDLNAPAFQSTYEGCVFVQHFKRSGYTGQLNAVNLITEEFTFGSKYFELQFEKLKI